MRNANMGIMGRAAGLFACRPPFWALALAGALVACGGKSNAGSRTLQSIALSPAAVELSTGAQQQLVVTGTYSDSTNAEVTDGISWSSSNPSVARMNGPGLVLATSDSTSAGTTTITASAGTLTAQASVTVTAAALLSITVSPPTASVPVPVLQPFTAIGHFSDGTTAPLVDVTWSCSDSAVATIDDSGFAQGVKTGGPVTITATAGSLAGTATLTITDPVLVSIGVSPASGSVPVGFNKQMKVTGRYSDGKSVSLSGASWSSSNDALATVNGTGLAHGVALGAVTITAAFQGFSSSASLAVTVPVDTTPAIAHFDAESGAGGASYFRVAHLDPATEYLVRATTAALDPASVQVEVHEDASFGGLVCRSFAGGPPCRSGHASTDGDLFVLVTAPAGTTFTLDTWPLPSLSAGGPALSGSVDTETYFKVENLTAATFAVTLAGLSDVAADVFVYSAAQPPGAFGSGLLCSTATSLPLPTKSCGGAVPLDGTIYITVDAWLTGPLAPAWLAGSTPPIFLAPGTDYTLSAM